MKRDLASSSTVEDLSARARQRDLSVEERRQLVAGLAASAEARLAHRAGAEFDAEDTVLPGDEALVERVLRRALTPPRARSSRWRQAWLAAAASLCVAAASFGAPWLAKRVQESPQPAAPRGSSAGAPVAAPSTRTKVPRATVDVEPSEAVAPELATGSPERRLRPAAPSSLPPRASAAPAFSESVAETAAQLYAEANRARRAGQTALAITRYSDLQRKFAGSAEAQSADMALGMLAMGQGRAKVALLHFGRVVGRGAGGGLLPEALWGQGQALAMLGQSDAARASYARILDEYPDSAYAAGARARLAASK
ncbi:MAG: tetratricopeptide repeat protein [Myxococcales bacterium]